MTAANHDLTGQGVGDAERPGPDLPLPLPLPAAAAAALDRWLDRLTAALPGPRRARTAILDELRDGLVEATRARLAAGADATIAAQAALAEFGDPTTVARAFAGELADRRARALTLALVGSGPLVGVAWLGALLPTLTSAGLSLPPWQARPAGLWAAWPLIPAVVATVLAATGLVIAATGRLGRWLPAHLRRHPRLAPATAAAAGVTTAAADLALLSALAVWALTTGSAGAPAAGLSAAPLLPVAIAASLVRLTLAARAANGCLAHTRPTPDRPLANA